MNTVPLSREFEPANESHVKWLMTLYDKNHRESLETRIRNNPWGGIVDINYIATSTDCLLMYAEAVLKGSAWLPIKK